jgi:hypothetical protein
MNSRSTSIVLSGITIALLGVIAYLVYVIKVTPTITSPAPVAAQPTIITNTQVAVRKINATNLLAAFGNHPLSWAAIESTNYVNYINNLRAFACPEETIRDIIITDIAKVFGKRRAELVGKGRMDRFWLPTADEGGGDPELQKQLAALDEEQRALVKDLLGVDFQTEIAKYWQDNQLVEQRMYGFLPAEKQEQLKTLNAHYDALQQEIYSKAKGELIPEDEERLRTIEKAKEAEMAKLLTPQEMEEYQLRNSPTASTLRTQLAGFQPNEEEFRKIFKLQKTFDDQFNKGFDYTDENQMAAQAKAQQEAQKALQDEMKKTLGEQRYAEYARAQDPDYKPIENLANRYGLPKETAVNVYNMKQQAEQAKQQLESNPNLTSQQRREALAAIARQTELSLQQSLGPAYKTYQSRGGNWVNELAVSQVPEPPQVIERPVPVLPPVPPGFPPFPVPPGFFPNGQPAQQ